MATEVVEVAAESEEDVRFWYSGKYLMRFAVCWRVSVRFCGFGNPLYAPLMLISLTPLLTYDLQYNSTVICTTTATTTTSTTTAAAATEAQGNWEMTY